eukprot:7857712-Lingulodinium_polyedra.AAC.1
MPCGSSSLVGSRLCPWHGEGRCQGQGFGSLFLGAVVASTAYIGASAARAAAEPARQRGAGQRVHSHALASGDT